MVSPALRIVALRRVWLALLLAGSTAGGAVDGAARSAAPPVGVRAATWQSMYTATLMYLDATPPHTVLNATTVARELSGLLEELASLGAAEAARATARGTASPTGHAARERPPVDPVLLQLEMGQRTAVGGSAAAAAAARVTPADEEQVLQPQERRVVPPGEQRRGSPRFRSGGGGTAPDLKQYIGGAEVPGTEYYNIRTGETEMDMVAGKEAKTACIQDAQFGLKQKYIDQCILHKVLDPEAAKGSDLPAKDPARLYDHYALYTT